MTSFINLLANDVWSEADIVNRTEAVIASQFPQVEILKRKVTGMMLGQYQLTPEEQAEFGAYAAASFQAGQMADAARADMALLRAALDVEAAQRRLALPAVEAAPHEGEGEPPEQPAVTADQAERAAAQAVIDAAGAEVLALVALRAPEPEPEPDPEELP